MNALDTATKEALRTAVMQAAEDSTVRCVLLTGTGRAFCVGQDLREHIGLLRAGDESLWRTVPEHYNPVAKTLATMPKPVVAALNGVAAGAGASIAMAADIRVVADSAGFNLAFAGIALSCDTGSSWWLPRLVGMAKAKELLMMPRTVKAEEALRLGLATEVVPDEKLAERGLEVARMLADGPTQAYAALRQSVVYAASHDLETSLDREAELMALTGGTADHHEAVDAFVAKRKPDFSGR
jgi:2-(1,2-epoxy-1,2-dihydrophenyl)acetyl-CoA isomerase